MLFFKSRKKIAEEQAAQAAASIQYVQTRNQNRAEAQADLERALMGMEIQLDLKRKELAKARADLEKAAVNGTKRDVEEAKRAYHSLRQELDRQQRSYEKAKEVIRLRKSNEAIQGFEAKIVGGIEKEEANKEPLPSKAQINEAYSSALDSTLQDLRQETLIDETYKTKMNQVEEAFKEVSASQDIEDDEADEIILAARAKASQNKEEVGAENPAEEIDYEAVRQDLENIINDKN